MNKFLTVPLVCTLTIAPHACAMFTRATTLSSLKTFSKNTLIAPKSSRSLIFSSRGEIQKSRRFSYDIKNNPNNETELAQKLVKIMLTANKIAVEKNNSVEKLDEHKAKELEILIAQMIRESKNTTDEKKEESIQSLLLQIAPVPTAIFFAPFVIGGSAMLFVGGMHAFAGILNVFGIR